MTFVPANQMRIHILRHGAAEEGGPDEKRALTLEGRQALRRVLARARSGGVRPSLILASSLLRALQTAELAAEVLGGNPVILQTKALLPHAAPRDAWEEIRARRDRDQLLLAGHEPLLGQLVAYLLDAPAAQVEMKKAALARVDVEHFGSQPRGTLAWLLPPQLAE